MASALGAATAAAGYGPAMGYLRSLTPGKAAASAASTAGSWAWRNKEKLP